MDSEKIYNFSKTQLIILSLKLCPPDILSTQYIAKIVNVLFIKYYIFGKLYHYKTGYGQFASGLHF